MMSIRSALFIAPLLFFGQASAQHQDNGRFVGAAQLEVARQMSGFKKQVGSHYRGEESTAGLTKTDCFIFTSSVISNALANIGQAAQAASVRRYREDGGDLAKYLVEKLGWTSWYWNPDVRHPQDLKEDHSFYAWQAARQKKHFYLGPNYPTRFVPIQRYLVNYDPVPQADYAKDVVDFRITRKNVDGIGAIRRNPFCFGITEGSVHTFLVLKGKVHEVHWDAYGPTSPPPTGTGEDKLYDVRDFFDSFSNYRNNGWLSGVLVCSPDTEPFPASTSQFDRG